MMKLFPVLILLMCCLLWLLPLRAQQPNGCVTWRVELKKISKDTFDIFYHAEIKQGWYLYSSQFDPTLGPIPTSINYSLPSFLSETFKLQTLITETGQETNNEYDEIWQAPIKRFANEATFSQRIVLLDRNAPIKGWIEWMVCNDESCLPADFVYFNFDLVKGSASLSKTPTP